jgi:hypothetical protein
MKTLLWCIVIFSLGWLWGVESFSERRERRMTAGAADERVRLIYTRWPKLRARQENQLELQIP